MALGCLPGGSWVCMASLTLAMRESCLVIGGLSVGPVWSYVGGQQGLCVAKPYKWRWSCAHGQLHSSFDFMLSCKACALHKYTCCENIMLERY